MLVYGRNVSLDLLKNQKKVYKAILQEGFHDEEIISMLENAKIKVEFESKKKMDDLASGVHQGIILSIPDYSYYDLNSFFRTGEELVVILDHIEDPHNFGAIIRTCEAAGIQSIIIPQDRQVMINSTVMKTSVGTLDNVKIIKVSNIVQCIEQLKKNGFWVVGTALHDSVDYREIDYSGKIAIIIGNEGKGITNLVSKKCDYLAKIPMYGKTNSLNASVATGIMIYEVIRNRK